jgi:hypothetical protein
MPHQLHLVTGALVALFGLGTVAAAHEPVAVYDAAPYELPPPGLVHGPFYVVNQGPSYAGPGIVAIRTFAVPAYYRGGGYAYGPAYPYVRGYDDWDYGPGYAPVYRPPYWHGRVHRRDDAVGYGPRVYRRNVFRPHAGAYRYRPAPSARVLKVNQPRVAPPAAQPPMPQARPQTPAAPPAKPGQPDAGGHSR